MVISNSDIISVSPMRGQVWLVEEPYEVTDVLMKNGYRIECKTRPYLVIGINSDLIQGDVCVNCIPITSNVKLVLRYDIVFKNAIGKANKIKCDQLTTKDAKFFVKLLYTLSPDIFSQVMEMVSRRIGLKAEPTMEETINELVARLDKIESSLKPEPKKKSKSISTAKNPIRESTGNRRWDTESIRQFLEEYKKSKDKERLSRKWGFSSKEIMYRERYRLQERLNRRVSP